MPRYIFIVARGHPELRAHLAREFITEEGVEVLIDRRQGDRRRRRDTRPDDRRRFDRRAHPPIKHELRTLNFALVRAE